MRRSAQRSTFFPYTTLFRADGIEYGRTIFLRPILWRLWRRRKNENRRGRKIGADVGGGSEHGNIGPALLVGGNAVARICVLHRVVSLHSLASGETQLFADDTTVVLALVERVFEALDAGLKCFDHFAAFRFELSSVVARPACGICRIVPICSNRLSPISSPLKSSGVEMIAASAIPSRIASNPSVELMSDTIVVLGNAV